MTIMRFNHSIIWGIIFTVVLIGITALSFYFFVASEGQNGWGSVFIPGIIWIIISYLGVHFLGNAEDRSIQQAALRTIPGLIGFAAALIGGIYSAYKREIILFVVVVLIYYGLSYLSWVLLNKQIPLKMRSFSYHNFWKRFSDVFFFEPPLFALFHYWKKIAVGKRVVDPDAAAQMLTFRDAIFYTGIITTLFFSILLSFLSI